jgi:choline-sulfatase
MAEGSISHRPLAMSRPLRYTFILVVVALAAGLAAAGGWRYARASAPVSGPIVVVSIDTLRADHLPAYGYTSVRTPAIDALAADGIVFERAYSHAPQTLPAHVALLSGRLPFETGVRDNVGFTVKPGERMLAQMLRDRGFATAAIVSSFVLRKETGIAQGFDYFDGDMPPAAPDEAIGSVQRDGMQSETLAEHWLGHIGTSRAFLFLHLYEPHKPYRPPDRFSAYAPYDGEIAYADEIVGKLVRYLKSHQLYDRSTIVLLSDHGEGLGDHGEQEHGLFLYDEAIHVPLVIKLEGNEGAGRRVADVVQHIDLVPTILNLVKAPVPGNLRGRSLKPLADGSGHLAPIAVYSEALYARYHFGWSELTALTDERYRYVKAPREELYDLRADARERDNLVPLAEARTSDVEGPSPAGAGGSAERTRLAMRGALDRLVAGATIHPPGAVSDEARDRLQALGYAASSAGVAAAIGPLPDPKDKRDVLERYRAAADLAGDGRWSRAIGVLQQILRDEPEMADAWAQLASFAARVERYEVVSDAYAHLTALEPDDPTAYLGAAAALLRLRRWSEARDQAERAAAAASDDRRSSAAAHDMLARVALAQRELSTARREAGLAHDANPGLPLPRFVEARALYDEGKYEEALPLFQDALAEAARTPGLPIVDWHFYAADTLGRLERYPEAEAEFLLELQRYPSNVRARSGLAMLYQASGRPDAAEQTLRDLLRYTPSPDAYALAARLFTTFGNRQAAETVRADAHRLFADTPRSGSRTGRTP